MTHHPDSVPDNESRVSTLPEDAAQPTHGLQDDSNSEKRIVWVSGALGRGLTRGYAAMIEVSSSPKVADSDYEGIDRVLQQVSAICREGMIQHVQSSRWGREVVVLVDADARFDWVLPAVQQRLRDELARRNWDLDPSQTQLVDLQRGDRLRLLGVEFRLVAGSGGSTVKWKRLKQADAPEPEEEPLPESRQGSWNPLALVQRCLGCLGLQRRGPRKDEPAEVAPAEEEEAVEAASLLSRVPGLAWIAALLARPASASARRPPAFLVKFFDKVSPFFTARADWRDAPVYVGLFILIVFGWRPIVLGICLGAEVLSRWLIPLALSGQLLSTLRARWLDLTAVCCGIIAIFCLVMIGNDLYSEPGKGGGKKKAPQKTSTQQKGSPKKAPPKKDQKKTTQAEAVPLLHELATLPRTNAEARTPRRSVGQRFYEASLIRWEMTS